MTFYVNGYTVHGKSRAEFTCCSRKRCLEAGQCASHEAGVILTREVGECGCADSPSQQHVPVRTKRSNDMSSITRRIAAIVICLSTTLAAPSLFAWGRDGHQIVATVAAHGLSQAAAAQVALLLDGK